MKKLHFIRANRTKHGGAEVYLSRLSGALEERGVVHEVVYSSLPKFLPSWLRVMLFDVTVCLAKKEKFYFSLERIHCPDIYRAGDGVHKVFMRVENKSIRNPLHMVYLYLEKRCFLNAKRIIANSHMVKGQIMQTYGIKSAKIDVVYNGVALEKVDTVEAFEKFSSEFDLSKDEKIILYVGSGFKRKGVAEFLKIVSQLTHEKLRAFVVGKEKKIAVYKQMAQALGIADRVVFTGARDDVKDFYAVADLFLFPTHYEPFSNVVLEAMQGECAVFTTAQNGAGEILDPAFVMSHPEDFSVVSKINELLSNEMKLQEIKETNQKAVVNFSIEKNLNETLRVIDETLH